MLELALAELLEIAELIGELAADFDEKVMETDTVPLVFSVVVC